MDFPIKNGDFPWPNVSSPEGMTLWHYMTLYDIMTCYDTFFPTLAPWQLVSTCRGMHIPNLQHFSTWNCWCLFELTWDQGAEPSAMIQSESDTAASALRTTESLRIAKHFSHFQLTSTLIHYISFHFTVRLVHAQAMMCWCQRSLSFLDAGHLQRSISTMLVRKFSMEPETAKLQIIVYLAIVW